MLTPLCSRYENLGVHYTLTVLGCIAAVLVSFSEEKGFCHGVLTTVHSGTDTISLLQVRA